MRVRSVHPRTGVDSETQRLNFSDRLDRLLLELDSWQGELRVDVARAELRGFQELAGDLRRLTTRVDLVFTTGRALVRARR